MSDNTDYALWLRELAAKYEALGRPGINGISPCPKALRRTAAVLDQTKLDIADYKELLEAERRVVGKRDGRIGRLEAALTKLLAADGDHMTACDRTMGATHPCTCGAIEARRLIAMDTAPDKGKGWCYGCHHPTTHCVCLESVGDKSNG